MIHRQVKPKKDVPAAVEVGTGSSDRISPAQRGYLDSVLRAASVL